MFFSVNAFALRIFSHVKLQEAFKASNKKNPDELAEQLAEKSEEMILSCFF